jgi:O-antigen ligase
MGATMFSFERSLVWVIRGGIALLLFTPLVIFQDLFFPFITGKNFFFRIIVEIIFGAWVILATYFPTYRLRPSPLLYAFASFIGILVISTFVGVDPYHSFWSNFERMEGLITHLHLFALFLVISSIVKDKKELFIILNISLSTATVVAVYAFLEHRGLTETSKLSGGGRPFATLGNSIYLAVYMMFHLFIVIALLWSVKNKSVRGIYGALFIFLFYIFFLAASRGAFIGFAVGVFVAALCAIYLSRSWLVCFSGTAIIIFLIALSSTIIFFPNSFVVQQVPLFNRLSGITLKGLQNESRLMIWGIALDAIRERPVFGWGPENFIIPYGKYYNPNLFSSEPWFDRAHNMLFEWLVSTGIIGFAAYISIFVALAFMVWRLQKARHIDTFIALSILGLFVAYIVQNVFVFDNIVTYIILVFLFASVHVIYVNRDIESAKKRAVPRAFLPYQSLVAACAVLGTVFLLYVVNIKPILAASQLITALKSLSTSDNAETIVQEFKKAENYNTFGTTEVHERLADAVVQIALQAKSGNQAFLKLLNESIVGLKQEVDTQPLVAKYPIFLGKVYTIRINLTGERNDEAEKYYKQALVIAPNYVQTYLGFAELYLITGKYDKAMEAANTAYRLPNKVERRAPLFFPVLSVKVLTRNYDDATQFLKSEYDYFATWPDFDDKNIQLLVERSLSDSKNLEGRLRFLETLATKLDKAYVYIGLAQTHGELGHAEPARRFAEKAAELDPSLRGQVDKFIKSLGAIQ